MFTILDRGDHLAVTLEAITRDAVAQATLALMTRPDYPRRNDLWDLTAAPVFLSQEDLAPLVALVAEHYPAQATRDRTALVVRGGFQWAVAEMWTTQARYLPCAVRAFTSRARAESWLRGEATPDDRSGDPARPAGLPR